MNNAFKSLMIAVTMVCLVIGAGCSGGAGPSNEELMNKIQDQPSNNPNVPPVDPNEQTPFSKGRRGG
jgi:hypothetical protein